ncbi:MAG: NAD(P)-binding protein [Magnetococcales bacterium]|nr:NAD(P)-binding protein [Magnetococcales bacterium]
MSDKPFAITLDVGSSLSNLTGSWRSKKPVFVDRMPPCNQTCPAGENIQQWLFHAEEGNYHLAWQEIMKNNPLPAIMGRACYHTCESRCNRAQLDETVGIHAVERFLGDLAIENGWQVEINVPPSGKRVMVIGSGPGGLSAAYHLTLLGHQVVVFEATPMAGGILRYGIPRYRLPRKFLDAEIKRIEDMGVEFRLNTAIKDVLHQVEKGRFDAVFAAIGAQKARQLDIPTDGSIDCMDAIKLLKQVETQETELTIGERVAVYGGGNVAIDAARSAVRLGAKEVTVVYRRSQDRMPAHKFEIKEALEEGVKLKCLRVIRQIENGTLQTEQMVLTDTNKPFPTGEMETMRVDTLIMALGQLVDADCCLSAIPGVKVIEGNVQIDQNMKTGHEMIFAGGDMVPCERTITVAVGHGKKAAQNINAFLRGFSLQPKFNKPLAEYKNLNTWYFSDAPKTVQPILSLIRRQSGFEEVLGNLDESNALFEARRCLSCGNCFECDNCYGACPDNAITKLGPGKRFKINYDYCKGCGLCAVECPCGAIDMIQETI